MTLHAVAEQRLLELDRKWEVHPDLTEGVIPVLGTMSQIGG